MHGISRARNRLTNPYPWHNKTKILDKLVKCDWEKPCKTIIILLPVSKMDPSWPEGEPDHRQSFHLSPPEMFLLLLLNNIVTKRMLSLKKDYNWAVLQVNNFFGSQDLFQQWKKYWGGYFCYIPKILSQIIKVPPSKENKRFIYLYVHSFPDNKLLAHEMIFMAILQVIFFPKKRSFSCYYLE